MKTNHPLISLTNLYCLVIIYLMLVCRGSVTDIGIPSLPVGPQLWKITAKLIKNQKMTIFRALASPAVRTLALLVFRALTLLEH